MVNLFLSFLTFHYISIQIANNLSRGESMVSGRTLNDNVPLFSKVFEVVVSLITLSSLVNPTLFQIGRRYKIMNPSKMRSTYGKLMYILMDTESYAIKSELKICFVKPILTVYSFLEEKECLDMLQDPLLATATVSISNDSNEKSKRELILENDRKKGALELLLKKYTSGTLLQSGIFAYFTLFAVDKLTGNDVKRVIDSIADHEAYLDFNVKPVDKIIALLKDCFHPKKPEDPFSLHLSRRPQKKMFSGFSLYNGYSSGFMGSGACLTHDHPTQFKFVLQSFTLWRDIMFNMQKLWLLADIDMLTEAYRLVDTGQGYQRLQPSPRIRREMSRILSNVQQRAGSWVGLSVVHLGDRDVPNGIYLILC